MLPVVGWDEKIVLFQASGRPHIPEIKHWNKTLKQPETVLVFAHNETEIKLEIWGTAQLETTQCPKFDWKYNFGGCAR